MSRFLGKAAAALAPYTPGEQPQDKRYIKLNTNECPYGPAPGVEGVLRRIQTDGLRLYPDPEATLLRGAMAECHGVTPAEVFVGGGSDEILGYAFMAFFDRGDSVCFADITYGFYTVYAQLCGLRAVQIPLREDFSLAPEDYYDTEGHIFIANPNAPTGMVITPAQIEALLLHNPDRLVVVDEAYVDFAPGMTCVPLLRRYDNLLVVQTYSKSRALAGMRIACALGSSALIAGLERIKYSFNPYNMDRVSVAVGIEATQDKNYLRETVQKITATRDWATAELKALGFEVLESASNFLFARRPGTDGGGLYRGLKENGILVRHFDKPRIRDFVRITIGTPEEMQMLVNTLGGLL